MKYPLYILFSLISSLSFGQFKNDTILFNNVCACELKVIYSDSIENDSLLLSRYSFVGLNKFEAKRWMKKIDFYGGLVVISKSNLTNFISPVCKTKMKKDIFIEAIKETDIKNSVHLTIGYLAERN